MRLGLWAERAERRHVDRLVAQNLVAVACGADLAQFSDTVAVIVDADVAFGVSHLAHCVVVARIHLVSQGRVACAALDVHIHVVVGRRQILDVFFGVAHRHQLGDCDDAAVADV